jgi:YesN/AraC family two-component response regulator
MVSLRCIVVVKDALEKLGLQNTQVKLGEVSLKEEISDVQLGQIRFVLLQSGFELLEDKRNILIQQIKTHIIRIVYYSDEPPIQNLSVHLSETLHHDYTYMSNLFSERLGITIEKFYISHKIERVKELLTYGELSLTDIAVKMHYSSVAHLSSQFKKVAGMTTSVFKQKKGDKRDLLENLCG